MLYSFLDLELDANRRELRRGGARVQIEPKAFDLVVYLIQKRDRVVSKSELLDGLWPDEDVYEAALSVCIHRARQSLGGPRGGREIIANIARRGYRFAVDVEEHDGAALEGAKDRFINRTAELASIGQALNDVVGGAVRAFVIVGDTGIGKSRLLEQASLLARRHGLDVLWAHGSADSTQVAFACWRELLRAYMAAHGRSALMTMARQDRMSLRPLIPISGEEVHAADGIGISGEPERSELFRAVARLIHRIATAHPLALVFDDLHLADVDSLRLLSFLLESARGPLLLLAAYHEADGSDDGITTPVLRTLDKHMYCRRLVLDRFAEADATTLLSQLARRAVSEPVRRAVLQRAQGNPLFLAEMWRYLLNQGLVHLESNRWVIRGDPDALDLPAGMRSVLGRRLAALSPAARRVLQTAALFGEAFDAGWLADVCEEPDAVRAALAEGVALQVLVAPAHSGDRYVFSHAHLREQLAQGLPPTTRHALHRQIGLALEKMATAEHPVPVADIAYHMVLGANAETADRASQHAERAGSEAFALLGFAEAARWFDCSASLIQRFGPAQPAREARLLIGLGEALTRTGDHTGARSAFRAAGALAPHAPGDRNDSRIADQPIEIDRLLSLFQLGIGYPAEDADLRAEREVAARERMVCAAVEQTRRAGDVAALATALVTQRWVASVSTQPAERLPISTEALLLADEINAPHVAQEARVLRIHDLLENGAIAEAETEIATYVSRSTELNRPVYDWIATYLQATISALHGRLAAAEALAQAAVTAGGTAVGETSFAILLTQLLGIRSYQGRTSEMVVLLEAFVEQHPKHPFGHGNLAGVYEELGRLDEARCEVERTTVLCSSRSPLRDAFISYTAASLARPCVRLDDARTAALFYDLLAPWSGTFLVSPLAVTFLGPADAYLGPLAEAAGRWQDAARHFEDAIDATEQVGNWPVRVHVQYEYARALLRRGPRRRRPVAMTLLAEAERSAQELELTGVLGWIRDLQNR